MKASYDLLIAFMTIALISTPAASESLSEFTTLEAEGEEEDGVDLGANLEVEGENDLDLEGEAAGEGEKLDMWTKQPNNSNTCSTGLPSKGKWTAYYAGKTEAQCKQVCDSHRVLIPVPDGIKESVYRFRQSGSFHNIKGGLQLPDFERTVQKLDYRGTGGHWAGWNRRDHFYGRWEANITIAKAGEYKFWTVSDDGSQLYVKDNNQQFQRVVYNPGWHGMRWKEGRITLAAGQHEMYAEMFEGGGGAGMQLYWQGGDSGNKREIVRATAFVGGIKEKAYYFRQNGRFHDFSQPVPAKVPLFERAVKKIFYNWRGHQGRGTGDYFDQKFRENNLRDHFYIRWEGYIEIKAAGSYKFATVSDDGSRLYINDKSVVQNGGWHGMRHRSGTVTLAAGKHSFWMEMFEGGGGAGAELRYNGPDTGSKEIIVPESALSSSLSNANTKLTTKKGPFNGGICMGFSHTGDQCVIYSSCETVSDSAEGVCGDKTINWVGDAKTFKTCVYQPLEPPMGSPIAPAEGATTPAPVAPAGR